MRMPFGKYAGLQVEELPTDYLLWLRHNIRNLREPLKSILDHTLDVRGYGVPGNSAAPDNDVIKRTFRELALK